MDDPREKLRRFDIELYQTIKNGNKLMQVEEEVITMVVGSEDWKQGSSHPTVWYRNVRLIPKGMDLSFLEKENLSTSFLNNT